VTYDHRNRDIYTYPTLRCRYPCWEITSDYVYY